MKRVLNRLDSVHQKLSTTVAAIDPSLFPKRPAENEWSVAEVIQHLCLVEARTLSGLELALHAPPARVSLLKKLIPAGIVSVRFPRVKAPKTVEPLNSLPKEESLSSYNDVRAQLKQFCIEHGRKQLNQTSLRHPFFGDIDGVTAVSMVAFHEQRHYKQIREILKKLGQPL
jgi:DinB family protein